MLSPNLLPLFREGAQISRMHALRRLPFEPSRLAEVDALTEDPETVEAKHGPESQSSDGAAKKKAAKSAISVVSYPELPLPGYGLTLIPNCNAVCGNALGTSIYIRCSL